MNSIEKSTVSNLDGKNNSAKTPSGTPPPLKEYVPKTQSDRPQSVYHKPRSTEPKLEEGTALAADRKSVV